MKERWAKFEIKSKHENGDENMKMVIKMYKWWSNMEMVIKSEKDDQNVMTVIKVWKWWSKCENGEQNVKMVNKCENGDQNVETVKKMWKWWSRTPWDHPMEEIRAGCNCLPQAHCCKKENSDPNISFSPDYIDFDNLFLCLSSYFVWWYFVGIYQIGWKVSEKLSLLLIIVIRLH